MDIFTVNLSVKGEKASNNNNNNNPRFKNRLGDLRIRQIR